ncbi:MAG: hypothetical protein ACKVOE_09470 [Rickettsiales bacterium]
MLKRRQSPSDEETLSPEGARKRHFMKTIGSAAVAASVVGLPIWLYNSPHPYDMALLKMDTALGELALLHRKSKVGDTHVDIEPAKQQFGGIDARTLAPDGHESLVISPELVLGAQAGGAQNISQKPLQLDNCPSNIFIPYHLFEDARIFETRLHKNDEGKWRLRITIVGVPQARQVPILKAAQQGAADAVRTTGDALRNGWQSGWAVVDDALDSVGLGDGHNTQTQTLKQQADEAEKYEHERPHPYAEASFSMDMDFVPGHVPNLLFYNGRTLDNATYKITSDTLENAMREDRNLSFPIIPNEGVRIENGVGKTGIPQPVFKYPHRFFDRELARKVAAAKLLPEGSPSDGFIPEILHYLSKKTLHDNKLNGYELGAIAVATRCEQEVLNEAGRRGWRGVLDKFGTRAGAWAPDTHNTPGAIPGR